MGAIKKSVASVIILAFFTLVFAFFNLIGLMEANITSSLYFIIFFIWIFLEVIFSTM